MAIVANISEVYDILYDMKTEPAAKFLIFLTVNGLGLLSVVFVLQRVFLRVWVEMPGGCSGWRTIGGEPMVPYPSLSRNPDFR